MMTDKTTRIRPRPPLPLWLAIIAAAAAGGLMRLSFPAPSVWGLVFPALALLFIALMGRRVGGALIVGLVYGVVFFALLVAWTARYLGPIPWSALSALEGALTAVALIAIALAYRWIPRALPRARGIVLPLVVGALWTGQEIFLGSWPYGGFPWARLGMTQSESPLAAVASWTGVSGLSFLMVVGVALVIELVRDRAWRRPLRIAAPAVLLVAMLLVPQFPTASTGELRVGAVQGNGPTGYFDEHEEYAVIDAQLTATGPLVDDDLDLLIWPEGSVDYDPFQDDATARMLTRVVNRVGAPLLLDAATERGGDVFNTSMLWTLDGTVDQLHDKRHPVPFGEYVPDRAFYNAIVPDLIGLLQREYKPGTNPPLIKVGDVRIGLAICFDVIYDEVLREGVMGGAQLLVFQTNNADFRGTDENLQQLAFARMRAIEAGRSVVNVSTVGTSQIIRPDGATQSSLGADEAGALSDDVELRSGLTAGIVLGPWVQQLLLWGGLVALAVSGLLARRRR